MIKRRGHWGGKCLWISMFALFLLGGSLDRHGWKFSSTNIIADSPAIIVMLLFFSLLTFLISKD